MSYYREGLTPQVTISPDIPIINTNDAATT